MTHVQVDTSVLIVLPATATVRHAQHLPLLANLVLLENISLTNNAVLVPKIVLLVRQQLETVLHAAMDLLLIKTLLVLLVRIAHVPRKNTITQQPNNVLYAIVTVLPASVD